MYLKTQTDVDSKLLFHDLLSFSAFMKEVLSLEMDLAFTQLFYLPAYVFLSCSFLICKMEIIIPTSQMAVKFKGDKL